MEYILTLLQGMTRDFYPLLRAEMVRRMQAAKEGADAAAK